MPPERSTPPVQTVRTTLAQKSRARSTAPTLARPEIAVRRDAAAAAQVGPSRQRVHKPISEEQRRRLMLCFFARRRKLEQWARERRVVPRIRKRDGKIVRRWNKPMPRMDWSLIAESHQFGIYRSVSSVKAWWAKFTAYAIANRLVCSRPAEYPTTHGSSPHL